MSAGVTASAVATVARDEGTNSPVLLVVLATVAQLSQGQ